MNRPVTPGPSLGRALRELRARHGWTLKEMSQKTGVPLSTLSKVEHARLSLSYDRLLQLCARLGLSPAEFFSPVEGPEPRPLTARRSIGRLDQAIRRESARAESYVMCPEFRRKRMAPVVTRVRARSVEAFGEPLRHAGEAYVYVLEGPVEVHTEFYDPVTLQTGESIYFDGAMGHAYVSPEGCGEALVLAVSSGAGEADAP